MAILPKEIKLTLHAQQRLLERKGTEKYNTRNIMKSSCKWYGKDDLIPESSLYIHCMYVCRKAKNKMGYITDGNIEVLYDKNAKVAITILEVKDKFKPITQYIKPEYLKMIELKKEKRKMKAKIIRTGICPDCGKEEELTSQGICIRCRTRKANAKHRGKEYIPYINLPAESKQKIDNMQVYNSRSGKKEKSQEEIITESINTIKDLQVPDNETYYQAKATQTPVLTHNIVKPIKKTVLDPLSDPDSFIYTLRHYGCEISEGTLRNVLDILVSTDKLKDIFMAIAKDDSQQTMLNLEQILTTVEKQLQNEWESNGFQEADDIRFKGFLTWRRILKGSILFWKKLYQTNALTELQKAWSSCTTDSDTDLNNNSVTEDTNNKDNNANIQKRYQITTESISTIFNTRRPFTRVFYAVSKEEAYEKFVKWMSERQLHEDKSKTTIVELSREGEDGRTINNEVK